MTPKRSTVLGLLVLAYVAWAAPGWCQSLPTVQVNANSPVDKMSPATAFYVVSPRRIFESDHAFDSFITPVSNPVFFEDPRAVTELRFLFINQLLPEDLPLVRGGDFQVYAMQVRVALTESLSFIATKDGFITLQPDEVIPNEQGFADVALGLKYTWLRDPEAGYVAAVGLTYEIDLGSHRVLQGHGDGIWQPFFTGGIEVLPGLHYLTAFGFRLPNNTNKNTQSFWWSHHLDYQFCENLYPLVELNWYHYLRSGNRLPLNFDGLDLVNLGSADVAGHDIITLALGLRHKISESCQLGCAYEFPITQREDILDQRLTVDLIVRY